MLFEGIILGIIVALFSKGSIKHIDKINFKLWYLIVGAGILEFVFNLIRSREIEPYWQIIDENVFWIKILIYGLIIIALTVNIKTPGIVFAEIGCLLNGLVILFNGGRMPVSIEGIESLIKTEYVRVLQSGSDLAHTMMSEDTKLSIFSDIIHIKPPYPMPKTVSIGDFFLCLGVMVFAFYCLKAPKINQVEH